MASRTLPAMPGLAGLYARALAEQLPRRTRSGRAADPPTLRVEAVPVDRDHLAAYRSLCGFTRADALPATYPQTVAFPLVLALLTDPAFPFPAMGTLHIGNRICVRRPLELADATLDYEVGARPTTPHPRGRAVVVDIAATANGERVWDAAMELLRRGPAGPEPAPEPPAPDLPAHAPPGPARWRLPADLGRRYAAISGDRNPIHLTDLSARPFGFSRHIAHGMWTHARALAELENRLPDAYAVEVGFTRPVALPSAVWFGARADFADGHIDFGVTARDRDALLGRVRPL